MIALGISILSLLHSIRSHMILPERDDHEIRSLVISSRCRCYIGDAYIPCTQHLRDMKIVTTNDTRYFNARGRQEHVCEHCIIYFDQHMINTAE